MMEYYGTYFDNTPPAIEQFTTENAHLLFIIVSFPH